MLNESVRQYCERLVADVEAGWQRLPIAKQFAESEPIPLRTTLREHRGVSHCSTERVFSSPREAFQAALEVSDVAVVYGEPGAGKSVALKWAARCQAREVLEAGTSVEISIPVRVDLGMYKSATNVSDLLHRCRPNELAEVADGHIVWFLDGLDLLSEEGTLNARSLLAEIPRFARESHDAFITSTRPMGTVDAILDDWSTSVRIAIGPLTPDERNEWVETHCPTVKPKLNAFQTQNPENRSFLNNPLLFSMVLSACLEEGKVICDAYPGRAGLFDGFVNYAISRAKNEGRVPKHVTADLGAVQGVFWAALVSGEEERISQNDLDRYLERAFGNDAILMCKRWETGCWLLGESGLLECRDADGAWRVLHQQFAEYWAARHLAKRLQWAAENGWLAAELWDHFRETRLDAVTGQALGMLLVDRSGTLVAEALRILSTYCKRGTVSLLAQMGGSLATEKLCRVMTSTRNEPESRAAAAEALGILSDPVAIPALATTLGDSRWGVVHEASLALTALGSGDSLNALVRAAAGKDEDVRAVALEALSEMSSVDNAMPLAEALIDTDQFVRWAATWALISLRGKKAVVSICTAAKAGKPLLRPAAARRLKDLLKRWKATEICLHALTMRNQDKTVRTIAAKALGTLKSGESVSALANILKDATENDDLRKECAASLGQIGGTRARRALEAAVLAFQEKNRHSRTSSTAPRVVAHTDLLKPILVIDVCRENSIIAMVTWEALRWPSHKQLRVLGIRVRKKMLVILWTGHEALKDKRTRETLSTIILDKDSDSDERALAAQTLAMAKTKDITAPLLRAVTDSSNDFSIRIAAAQGLAGVAAPELAESLVHVLVDQEVDLSLRSAVADVLGRTGSKTAICALGRVLDLEPRGSPLRRAVAEALARSGSREGVMELDQVARDKHVDRYERLHAARTLAEIGSDKAAKSLLDLLRQSCRNDDCAYEITEVLVALGKRNAPTFCKMISALGKRMQCRYNDILRICAELGHRVEPWDLELQLESERRSRKANERTKGEGSVVNMYNPVFNSCIVNIESNIAGAIQRVGGQGRTDEAELKKLIGELKEKLASVPVETAEDAEAVLKQAEALTAEAAKPNPNKTFLKTTAKVMIEGTRTAAALVTLTPIVQNIARIVLQWFGT